MSLDRGTRLGHYEILEPLGAGGMGEVFKATDTRLDRTVAIKVLPPHLAESSERRERFEREARTISKLNHPDICTLHDVGSQDGIDFLVMEHIEGETLTDRLRKRPLTRDEALEYAVQITDALTKAHRAGIVHRDLKPGNIMLTKEGLKLLDFGLAKLVDTDSGADDSDAPTVEVVQKELTRERAVIGTPRYMAPEQLEGERADARTDLYAFGLILREMLTVENADIDRVVSKCLARDPDERWQSAKDLGDELRWLASRPQVERRPAAKTPKSLVAGALVLAAVANVGWWMLRDPELAAARAPTHLRMDIPGDGFRLNEYSSPIVISRDGARVVLKSYGADGDSRLFLRSMSDVDATPIAGTERGSVPVLSWDGSSVGFSVSGEILRVPLSGGVPEKVSDRPRLSSGAAWDADDTIVLSSFTLLGVPADGGVTEPLVRPREGGRVSYPQFLPDGETILFTLRTTQGPRPALASLVTGEYRVVEGLGFGRDGARYVPPGYIVWSEEGQLTAAAFDLDGLEVKSRGVPVLEGVHESRDSGLAYFTTSETGTLVYLTVSDTSWDWRVVLVDRGGKARALFSDRGYFRFPRFSPDGRKVAVGRWAEARDWDIWVYDLATGTRERLATGTHGNPVWSPDGNRIAFTDAGFSVSVKAVGGDFDEELWSSTNVAFVRSWVRESGLAIYDMHPESEGDIRILDEDGSVETWLATDHHEMKPEFSPDGKWIAYTSDETDREEVYVRPYPGPGGQKIPISSGGGRDPIWSPDGRELFYRNGRALMVVRVETEPSFRPSRPELLFIGPYASYPDSTSAAQAWYDISPDGQHFLMIENTNSPSDAELHVILNWDEELKRLVPASN